MKVQFILVLLFAITLEVACAYRILFLMPFASKSHKNGIDPIAQELGLRGHEITMMSPVQDAKDSKGVKNVYLSLTSKILDDNSFSFFALHSGQKKNFVSMMLNLMYDICNATYHEPEITKLITSTSGGPKYDAMMVNSGFNNHVLPIAHHLGIPVIYIQPAFILPTIAWNLNIPHPISYIPSFNLNMTSPMTFLERTKNLLMNVFFTLLYRNYLLFPMLDKDIRTNFLPNAAPILELERNVSFQLTNSHPAINTVVPSMPYFKEVGCLHCQKAKHLPKDLEKFVQSSGDDGVIYFSLGSVTKGSSMPIEMRDKLVNVFSKLKQQVLWKYESDFEVPNNVKLLKWAPQQDILAHPKVRLFISHGGALSTMEAAFHGCPLLGFPLGGDQAGNIASAKKKGFVDDLNWQDFTEDKLLFKINRMLTDNSYRENAVKLSVLLKDNPQEPREAAAYWVEYVIRHQGAPHLKSGAEKLNFFQYFLLDVIAVLILTLFIVLAVACFVLKRLYRVLCRLLGKKEQKTKSKKK